MSQLTDKAAEIRQVAQNLVEANEKLDNLHDQFNTTVQEYRGLLTRESTPDETAKPQVANPDVPTQPMIPVPTMKGDEAQ